MTGPPRVGLTGGIACGKTTVSNLFAELQVPVLDADLIAHELVQPGQATLVEIENLFGADYICNDGSLDRAKMRALIFGEPAARKRLEAVMHPRILDIMRKRAEKLSTGYCIFSIPLLVESGQFLEVQRVLVVDCTPDNQRKRLGLRPGMTQAEINNILRVQCKREKRLAYANEIIYNNSNITTLRGQVKSLHDKYERWASGWIGQR